MVPFPALRCLMNVKPSIQSLWLADEITQDPEPGKVTVSNIFDRIDIKRPATNFTSTAYLFFCLRGLHGEAELKLAYVDLSDNEALFEQTVQVREDDPLQTADVRVRLPKMRVPHDGEYA